jgi:hypothetical protein
MGFLLESISMLIPFGTSWVGIKFLKSRINFLVSCPENSIGGMTIGLAVVLWFSLSALGGLEYYKYDSRGAGFFVLAIFAVTTVAMLIGSICAVAFLKRDRSLLMMILSPVIAIISFIVAAVLMH